MVEKSQGPVRPPVLEGTARRTSARSARKPAEKAAATTEPVVDAAPATETPPQAESPKAGAAKTADAGNTGAPNPSGSAAKPASLLRSRSADLTSGLIGGLAGAILAAIIFLLLSVWNLLPQPIPAPDLSNIEGRLDSLGSRLAEIEAKAATTDSALASLDQSLKDNASSDAANLTSANQALALVDQRVSDLETAPAPDLPQSLTDRIAGLEATSQNLADRIDALAAGASSNEAADIADRIAALGTAQEQLASRIDALAADMESGKAETGALKSGLGDQDKNIQSLAADLAATNDQMTTLSGRVDELVRSAETQAANQTAAQVPLALDALKDRAATGAPFTSELAMVKDLLPDLPVAPGIEAAATSGLTPIEQLAADFTRAVPQMLAATPAEAAGSMGDQIAQSLQQIFAARNSAADDSSVAAVLARIEDALAAADVTAAAELVGLLPGEVIGAGGDVITAISNRAGFEAFMTGARAAILSDAAGKVETAQ
ncbi:MAG: hypothetical protein H6873_01900 [Hyphomicrobiaceae bacterium]|nr:hypothetical protein [Hyphomicrobiaceae bacterium]